MSYLNVYQQNIYYLKNIDPSVPIIMIITSLELDQLVIMANDYVTLNGTFNAYDFQGIAQTAGYDFEFLGHRIFDFIGISGIIRGDTGYMGGYVSGGHVLIDGNIIGDIPNIEGQVSGGHVLIDGTILGDIPYMGADASGAVHTANYLPLNIANGSENGTVGEWTAYVNATVSSDSTYCVNFTNLALLNAANGCEDGTVTPFAGSWGGVVDVSTNNYKSGTHCLKFNASGGAVASLDPNYLIPIVPDQTYTLSYYAKVGSGTPDLYTRIVFFDEDKQRITSYSTTPTTLVSSTNYQRTSYTIIATDPVYPNWTVAYAGFDIGSDSDSHTFYIDELQFELSNTPTVWSLPSNRSIKLTSTSSSDYVSSQNILLNLIIGYNYTLSYYLKNDIMWNITARWIDQNGTVISDLNQATYDVNASFARNNISGTCPSGAKGIIIDLSATENNSGTCYIDCIQFEEGNTPTDYINP